MYKIRKIEFRNHTVLGSLTLNFCDQNGKTCDTIIFAGENGVGKSTILNTLYEFATGTLNFEVNLEIESNREIHYLKYEKVNQLLYVNEIFSNDNVYQDVPYGADFQQRYPFHCIFSDVSINFNSNPTSIVTSLSVDEQKESRRSNLDLPNEINQLLIDIQTLDALDIAQKYHEAHDIGEDTNQIEFNERMPRFKNAFSYIFDDLKFKGIVNQNGEKKILFRKNGVDIPIEALSSGEKQIVYRGCFLLKDVNALTGAFVLIDEPEISLHPTWQMKILDYYKRIFTNEQGLQTSQIFTVTHSPFIIHNENRKNDKIIILKRNTKGQIYVEDKPEYYKCTSYEAVKDAFNISVLSREQPTVYLEGRTDEKYFNKALEVFNITDYPFKFKWIGYKDDNGQEANTGCSALKKGAEFLISQNLSIKNVFLFDSDTKEKKKDKNNVLITCLPEVTNSKEIKKGIENLLILDDIDLNPFYHYSEKVDDYGARNRYGNLDKSALCDNICAMNEEILKKMFFNLSEIINKLKNWYDNK